MLIGSAVLVAEQVASAELIQRARDHVRRSEFDAGRMLAVDAEEIARAADDQVTRAEALVIIANIWRRQDACAESLETALRAVEISRDIGALAIEARARCEITRVLLTTGDCSEGLQEALKALNLAEASGDMGATVAALTALGNVHLTLEQHELGMEACERAAEMARMTGDEIAGGALQDTIACALLGIGERARAEGDRAAEIAAGLAASERSRAAVVIAHEHGHRHNEATALGNLAEGLAMAGRSQEGLELLESWQLDPGLDPAGTIGQFLDTRGTICLSLGRHDEAILLYARALEVAMSPECAMWYAEHLATAYEQAGNMTAALTYYKQFHQLYRRMVSESAHRNARVAAVRLETEQAKAQAEQQRHRADGLLRLSLEDPLTGLPNRRHLDNRLAADVATFTLALLDVDHFKRVNDTFSHQTGDEVLRRLGGLLLKCSRGDDLPARYGGEEFAVMFQDLSVDEATAAAERLRQAVEDYPWETVAPGLAITISIGIAVRGESAEPESQLAIADRRLYRAKRAGRNRVISTD